MANLDDDDDFGFFAGGKSRLSSLFPSQAPSEDEVNQSLTYVPPKQPKKHDESNTLSLRNYSLLHVVSAYTYKLENLQYQNQGKLGAAILGDVESFAYKLLIYIGKTGKKQQVTLSTINTDYTFQVDPDWYAKFADDKGVSWSIKFGSEEQLVAFAKEVALARANTCGKTLNKLIVQDLVAGDGPTVEPTDSVGIYYTAWLFKNRGFSDMFEENKKSEKPLVVKLAKGNAIKGLCEGLIGAKKGMKRLIIVPSSLAFGSSGTTGVPPNQDVIYEVLVKKVKSPREVSSSPSHGRTESDVKPDVPPRTSSISDESIRSRGVSISEQLTQSPRKDNAKLISRMAKMGMPTLPLQGAVTATVHTSSESEPEKEGEVDRCSVSPKPPAVPTMPAMQSEVVMQDVHNIPRRSISSPRTSSPLVQTPTPVQQPATSVLYPSYGPTAVHGDAISYMPQPFMAQPAPAAFNMTPVMPGLMESHLPLLVTESRTQNTEIRMMLGKLSDKLDSVIPKLDEMKSLQISVATAKSQAPFMESSVLSQNIERIIQENIHFKQENEAKSSKIQELNEKICDILQRNQRFFEESNSILEQRSDSLQMTTSQLQSKVLSLEQEKVKLSSDLTETVSRLNRIQEDYKEKDKANSDLSLKLEACEGNLKELHKTVDYLKAGESEKKSLEQSHLSELEEWERKGNELKRQLNQAQTELKEAKDKAESLAKKLNDLSLEVEEQKRQLHAESDKNVQYKKKYDSLLENTRSMKNKYESQMESLIAELKQMKLQARNKDPSEDFSAEIKKAMNMLYKVLQSETDESQSYSGADVLKLTLNVIRRVTLRIISMGPQQPNDKKSDSNHSSRANSVDRFSSQNEANSNCDKVESTVVSLTKQDDSSELSEGDQDKQEVQEKSVPSSQEESSSAKAHLSEAQEQTHIPQSAETIKDAAPEQIASTSDTVAHMSEPSNILSEPAAVTSEPLTFASEPTPVIAESSPVITESTPVIAESTPVITEPTPVTESTSVTSESSTVISKPDVEQESEPTEEVNQSKDDTKCSSDPEPKESSTSLTTNSTDDRDSPYKQESQLCDDDVQPSAMLRGTNSAKVL